jgi:formylglycine-generating enzyme required for sulfatase activity
MGFSHTPLPPSLGQAAAFFPNGDADEQPFHPVSVSSFRISATETTNAQYKPTFLQQKIVTFGQVRTVRPVPQAAAWKVLFLAQ